MGDVMDAPATRRAADAVGPGAAHARPLPAVGGGRLLAHHRGDPLRLRAGAPQRGLGPRPGSSCSSAGWPSSFGILVVVRPRRWVWAGGLLLNLGIVVTWAGLAHRRACRSARPRCATRRSARPTCSAPCSRARSWSIAVVELLFGPALWSAARSSASSSGASPPCPSLAAVVVGSVSMTPAYAGAHSHGDGRRRPRPRRRHRARSTGTTPCELSGPPTSPGQASTDAEGHEPPWPGAAGDARPATSGSQLEAQQEQARTVAYKYPTVKDAETAGYRQSTAFVPCIGAHYTNIGLVVGVRPGQPVRAALRRHHARLEDRRAELPGVPPGWPARGLRRPERPLAPAQRQNGGLCFGKSRWRHRRRVHDPGGVRRPSVAPSASSPTSGWCTTGSSRAGSAPGARSPVSAPSSVAASAARPGTRPTPQTGQALVNGGS